MAQNPKTPEDKKNRMLNFTVILNRFIVEKALKNEDIFTFNNFTAPFLNHCRYSFEAYVL
jgi:hypothetical protein